MTMAVFDALLNLVPLRSGLCLFDFTKVYYFCLIHDLLSLYLDLPLSTKGIRLSG